MKAISLHQPFASLIAGGAKSIETRSWSTRHRGPLAIHAAKRKPRGWWSHYGEPQKSADPLLVDMAEDFRFSRLFDMWEASDGNGDWRHEWTGPLGCVVATCELIDVVPIVAHEYIARVVRVGERVVAVTPEELGPAYARVWTYCKLTGSAGIWWSGEGEDPAYGNFAAGRFAWLLGNVQPLEKPIPAPGRQGLWNCEVDL